MNLALKKCLFLGLATTIALFVYSLFSRIMHVDDVILAEPTYWLSQIGYLKSPGMLGWQNAEYKFLFTHKLYVYTGAIFITLFGWSSAAVKSVSLAYLAILLGISWLTFKRFKVNNSWFALYALLLLANSHIFELSFVYRPEVAVATCMLGCFLLLDHYLENGKVIFLISAGLVAALGIGNHLNGVIIPGAGCLLLLCRKKWVAFFAFGLIAALGFLFQLLGITNAEDFQLMINQFSHMQDIQADHFRWYHYLLNIPNEQKRYLHSPREIAFTLLLLPMLYIARHELMKRVPNLVWYTFFGALCLAVIAHGKSSKYLTLVTPLWLLLTTIAFSYVVTVKQKLAYVLLAISITTQTVFNVALAINKEKRNEAYNAIAGDLPEGASIVTPVYATYWATPEYKMQWFYAYKIRASHNDFTITAENLNQELVKYKIDYALFDREEYETYKPTPENMPDFELKKTDEKNGLWFFARKVKE